MKWTLLLLPVVVLAGPALPAQAQLQIFGRNKARLNMQVPELIVTARTDPDERRRLSAIEQLRESDSKTFPDIVSNLIEVMLHDPKYGVRMEAMHSLVKIRPMSQPVAQALQQTAAHDDNWRVRMQTKTQIFVNGYHGGAGNGQNAAPTGPTTNEPPLGTSTVIGQPVYVPNSGSAPVGPNNMGRPLPSRPGYSTSSPQSVTEIPLGVQPQATPPPQPQAQSYAPVQNYVPPQQVTPQRPGPLPLPQVPAQPSLPLPPAAQPLPQVPPAPPAAQPLPQVPAPPPVAQPSPQIPSAPVSQSAPPPEPVDTPISPPSD